MNWEQLLTVKRFADDRKYKSEFQGRSIFQQDYDRITFTSSFRRMGRKTQVHPLIMNDHIHTRLTHSIEVGNVGRSLGSRIGYFIKNDKKELPRTITPSNVGEIVQAACIAHDIGNPPFGHAGEDAISSWFMEQEHKDNEIFKELLSTQKLDLQMFEGNASGFRILVKKEIYQNDGGMRLHFQR